MIPLLNDIVNVDGNDIIQVEIDGGGGGGGGGGRWYCIGGCWLSSRHVLCLCGASSIVRRHRSLLDGCGGFAFA